MLGNVPSNQINIARGCEKIQSNFAGSRKNEKRTPVPQFFALAI
jgi:hypothetical protein